jgi:hypothetical protein
VGLVAHLKEMRTGHPHVIGLDREDAGRCVEELLLLDQRGCAGVGGNADILEQHAAEQEAHFIGEGIEIGKTGSLRSCSETSIEIDGRPAHRLTAQRLAVEPHMRQLILGQFLAKLSDSLVLEGDLAAACHFAGIGTDIGGLNALSGRCPQIILGFHIFEVQGELENVLVLDVLRAHREGRGGCWRQVSRREARSQQSQALQ